MGVEELPLAFANQFLGQIDADGTTMYLTAGVITPPTILGDEEERQEQLSRLSFLPVQPVARLALSRHRFEELRQLLDKMAANWQAATERGSNG